VDVNRKSVRTVKALCALWGDPARLAADLGLHYTVVAVWCQQGRIPEEHWPGLVASARRRDIPGVTRALIAALPDARGVTTFREVIDLWPSQRLLATSLGAPHASVRGWRARNTIPARWWSRLLDAAAQHGVRGLDYTILAKIAEGHVDE
jgi:hypothetical protein